MFGKTSLSLAQFVDKEPPIKDIISAHAPVKMFNASEDKNVLVGTV